MHVSVSRLKRVRSTFSLTMIGILTVALPGYGQTTAVAEVSGLVTDQTGAAVPGALVRMLETDKQAAHTVLTDPQGRYVLPNLPVGPYRLHVQAKGFKVTCRREWC